MENIVITVVLIIVVGGASLYIWNAKKKGQKCIGCPCSGGCKACKNSCSSSKTTDITN